MDPSARLDHVLFQLTPTRTRCELVIFAGKSNEKLAYGLLEPFIAHLRSARDQITKGGYSVTLRPPSNAYAPWFTKVTLQRFVRFVSTPEVLERFVTIEREISQLENSIKSYEASNADGDLGTETEGNAAAAGGNSKTSAASFKSKRESNDSSDPVPEENSKARLHRVVETRKAVLRREQAMVYARALAAGYDIINLDDLLSFSDAFGASRLREACINFKDLCKKKSEDRLWVDEIAAVQAIMQPDLSYLGTSGIILAGEDTDPAQNFMMGGQQNGSTDLSMSDSMTSHGSSDANQDNGSSASAQTVPTDAKAQIPNPWANHFPQYLRNFQGPVYHQMPPYQGYAFPGMQVAPPYYPPNMQWPPNADQESHHRRNHKSSSRKKDKGSKSRGSENEKQDGSTEPSGSNSETDTDSSAERSHRKRHGKKSSRKVVIRNINYITSKRDGEKNSDSETDSSEEGDYLDGGSLKQQLEDAVGSFEKHQKTSSRQHRKRNGSKHLSSVDEDNEDISSKNNGSKGNENWDAFQHLLLKDESNNNGPESVQVGEDHFAAKLEEQNSYAFKKEAEERAKQTPFAADVLFMTEKGAGDDGSIGKFNVENFDSTKSSLPKKGNSPEEFMFAQRNEEPESYRRVTVSDDAAHSSVIKSHTSDDWFISKQSTEATNQGENNHLGFIDGDYVTVASDQVEKKRKDVVIDDSLMIQGRLMDDQAESQMRTDISFVSDIVEASHNENGMAQLPHKNSEPHGFYEPVDLYMVRDRDTVVEQPVPSWTPEMDYSVSPIKAQSDADVCADSNLTSNEKGPSNKKTGGSVTKTSSKDARSRALGGALRKGKPDTTPGSKRSTFGTKSSDSKTQLEKDAERRRRMEELVLRRQKRIAERSAVSGGSPMTSRKSQTGTKAMSAEETKKPKAILRTSTIERLAAAKTSPKVTTAQPKKTVSKVNNGSQKNASTDSKKVVTTKTKTSEKKPGDENVNGVSSFISDAKEVEGIDKIDGSVPPMELPCVQEVHASNEPDDSKDIKELHITSSVLNEDVKAVSQTDTSNENGINLREDHSTEVASVQEEVEEIPEESVPLPEERKFSGDHVLIAPELSIHPVPESPTKTLGSALIVAEKATANGNVQNFPEISEIEESTPPQNEMSLDPIIQSRKKWDNAENSPKATKGFRKLLMFGRKS